MASGFSQALTALFKANPECNLAFNGPLSSTCACEDIKPVTVGGVTAKGFTFNQSLDHVFAPIWPGSSPFVTSVGASYFNTSDGQTVSSEIVSSTLSGAIFTTGGGFSYFQNQESYQSSAVKEWIKRAGDRAPPSWAYSPQYRVSLILYSTEITTMYTLVTLAMELWVERVPAPLPQLDYST